MRKTINSSLPHKLLTALVILSMVMVALPATTAYAAGSTITVTTTNDEYDGGPANLCSLREAVALANHPSALTLNDCSRSVAGPDDEIVLQSGSTYTLTLSGTGGTSEGDLDVGDVSGLSGNLTITTSGAGSATIDGNDTDRVFDVGAAGNPGLALNNIVVTDGNTTGLLTSTTGGGISFSGTGTLSLTNVTVSSNVSASTAGCGGGLYNNSAATVVIIDSTISGNSCPNGNADGAGIFKGSGGSLSIFRSTISGNTVGENGGGIHIGGTATATTVNIVNSTFANNIAGNRGGGMQIGNSAAVVTVDFTTFSGNGASESTITPSGLDGGGALQVSAASSVTVTRSILANSTSTNPGIPEDCDVATSVTTVSVSDSIIETNVDSADSDCGPSGVLNVDPQLGPLADNGGPTQTMGISLASPAYNAADSCGIVVVDQRGATRPQVGACDLGAYESGNTTQPIVVSVTRVAANPTNDATVDFTVTFSHSVTGVDVTDFKATVVGITGESVTAVSGSGTTRTVTVNTGSGDGTLRLDVLDDGTIVSGADGLDGGFTNGEVYDVDKTAPTASITRTGESIVDSSTVDFGVSFSETVSGVNTADFSLATSGVTGASVSGVTGLGATYTVTVNTGTGDGTIGLNLNGAGTGITDAAGNAIAVGVTGEVYTILSTAAAVDVNVANITVGDGIVIPFDSGQRHGFAVDNGPAKVYSTNGFDIVAALRVIWREPGIRTSYSEMMGLPVEQLSDEYWFPWYNNLDVASMDQGFRIANVDTVDTTVKVMLGTTELDSFTLPAGASVRTAYPVNDGPIQIYSEGGHNILAALRVIWQEPGPRYSYSEMMGLPVEQLSDEYWFPWYNNLDVASMDQGFRIAMVNGSGDNTIEVRIAGVLEESFTLAQGDSVRVGYDVNNGPAQILCTTCTGNEKIVTSLRVIWKEPGFRATYSEMMGLPTEQLSTNYWFPWYNNADVASMDQGFRIATVNASGDNTVQVWVAGIMRDSFTLTAGESVRVGYPVNAGPAWVVCTTCTSNEKIVTSLRVIWKEPGVRTSYSEMMGLPNEALSNEYWFPWYNNLFMNTIMDQGFRISTP